MNIFSKTKIVAKSSIHALLDKMIDMNDVGALEEMIRELEDAMKGQDKLTLQAEDQVQSMPNKIKALRDQFEALRARAKRFKDDGDASNDHLIKPTAERALQCKKEADELEAELVEATENAKNLRTISERLDTKHETMMSQLKRLRKAKQKLEVGQATLQAVEQVNDAMSGVDADRFSGAVERAETDARVTQRQLSDAANSMPKSDAEIEHDSAVADFLSTL